jgi:hypothetical protein
LGDLALLAMRLRPWNEIVNLPGQGTSGYDPIICLVTYLFLLLWMGGNQNPDVQEALVKSMRMAIPAGLLAIGYVVLSDNHTLRSAYLQIGLLVGAAILSGLAGWQGAKITKSPNLGIAAGVWSAMVSALMAVAVVLARIDLNNPLPQSTDPWKQYQGLAIGNQTVQSLVHSLNMGTGFLLISPLVGGTLGLVFAMATQE